MYFKEMKNEEVGVLCIFLQETIYYFYGWFSCLIFSCRQVELLDVSSNMILVSENGPIVIDFFYFGQPQEVLA